ncbi:MAG: PLP-dependent aspartate aminotransferase family protein [Nocardioides sp.]
MAHDSNPDTPAWSAETVAVTAGRPARVPDAPLNEPIMLASTFIQDGPVGYGRYGNATWTALEEAVGALEGGLCLTYASGMSAVHALLDLVAVGEKVVVARHTYNGVTTALADLEARGRLRRDLVDATNVEEWRAAAEDAALVWLESPTNPALEIVDLPAVIEAAHAAGARVVVDNTFATPLLQQPLALGADVVVHSATKYLAGHSDVVMGAVVTADEKLYGVLKGRRDLSGAVPGPFEAWLTLRGLRTLPVRFERAQATAADLAQRLATHPRVEQVLYPGFGGIVSIVLADALTADAVVAATRLWVPATSLGGVESTLERRRRWRTEPSSIPEGLVRLSVGLESADDLWADLEHALSAR